MMRIVVGLLVLGVALGGTPTQKRLLDEDWTVEVTKAPAGGNHLLGKKYPTSIPATLHLVLEKAKELGTPFIDNGMEGIAWVSECYASFAKSVTLSPEDLLRPHIEIVFQGLDTYASIFVNGQHIASTNNSFVEHRWSIRPHLRSGANILRVDFTPSAVIDRQRQALDPMPFAYAHTRKPAYQYGWDWAPPMASVGIWRSVYLLSFDDLRLDYFWVRTQELAEESAKLQVLVAVVAPRASTGKQVFAEVTLYNTSASSSQAFDPSKTLALRRRQLPAQLKEWDTSSPTLTLSTVQRGEKLASETLPMGSLVEAATLTFSSPRLWWPNTIGSPHLYEVEVRLVQDGVVIEVRRERVGLKSVSLEEAGRAFTVHLNGYPVYCRGANYVPPDMQYPRVVNGEFGGGHGFERLLYDAKRSNFNMLRVWGGGQYEEDYFYELCAELGLMLFHDFMFSDSIYPADPSFVQSVAMEAHFQLTRLRNQAALVLWAGNNEILQGIQSWGWAQPHYQHNYQEVFEQLLRQKVAQESPHLPYIASSPSKGVGNYGFDRGGDVHYWGVWAAGSGFESYASSIGGFNSEFGTQALPVWATLTSFITNEHDRSYDSKVLASHEKHGSQFTMLRNYMGLYARVAPTFELEVYQSGLVQAFGVGLAIRAQRLAKPSSWGTLYWQLNDAWTAISWSSIDYEGHWKPLQYLAKQLYAPIAALVGSDNALYLASDELVDRRVLLFVEVLELSGKVVFSLEKEFSVGANSQVKAMTLEGAVGSRLDDKIVYAVILRGASPEEACYFSHTFASLRNLDLQPAALRVELKKDSNQLVLSTGGVLKSVHIYHDGGDLALSDNYFDLVPHFPRTITLLEGKLAALAAGLRFRSYFQVYTADPLSVTTL